MARHSSSPPSVLALATHLAACGLTGIALHTQSLTIKHTCKKSSPQSMRAAAHPRHQQRNFFRLALSRRLCSVLLGPAAAPALTMERSACAVVVAVCCMPLAWWQGKGGGGGCYFLGADFDSWRKGQSVPFVQRPCDASVSVTAKPSIIIISSSSTCEKYTHGFVTPDCRRVV